MTPDILTDDEVMELIERIDVEYALLGAPGDLERPLDKLNRVLLHHMAEASNLRAKLHRKLTSGIIEA